MQGDAYIVAVLDGGTLSPHQKIEAEVRFARELEHLLGGPEEVVRVCEAALHASSAQRSGSPVIQCWSDAVDAAASAARREVRLRDIAFEVRLDQVNAGAVQRA
jgi:hypothetical protein